MHNLFAVRPVLKRLNNIEVKEGESKTVKCEVADANPEVTSISWQNVNSLPDQPRIDNDTLKLESVDRGHAGTYRCRAENSYGISEIDIDVFVLCKLSLSNRTMGYILSETIYYFRIKGTL